MRFSNEIAIIETIKNIFYANFFNKQCLSRIENIDYEKEEIIVYTRGIHAPIYLKFIDIIQDKKFLASFSSRDASFLGYCFGLSYFKLFNGHNWNDGWFISSQNDGNYFMLQGIDRRGNIIYLNTKGQIVSPASPSQIMMNNEVITRFQPIQSCYVGILAGINDSKREMKKHSTNLT